MINKQKSDYYNQISEGYEELHKEEQEKKLNLIKKHLKIKGDELLLDVGCGTGITSDFPCKVIGMDPAIKLLKKSKLKIKILAEAEHIPFKDNTFDIVSSITAIQNFYDIEQGLKEIERVGKDIYVLSFLKKSKKKDEITRLIKKYFRIEKELEEDKDLIFICKKN